MAIKPTTTSQMITRFKITGTTMSLTSNWFRMLKARAQALASDGDHTFTYRDRDDLTKNTTRQRIVNVYETAYSELAESFHGIVDRNEELESEAGRYLRLMEDDRNNILEANNRIAKLERRIEGFLTIIEGLTGSITRG